MNTESTLLLNLKKWKDDLLEVRDPAPMMDLLEKSK